MDILHSVEEKYLQAIEELRYGELPKALHLFNQIVESDPDYARAYYQLGCIYHYELKDFQAAGYYFKKCIELDSLFPDVYEHYLKLLITLEMHKNAAQVAAASLLVPGVCKANIHESLGLFAEERQDLKAAITHYAKAAALAANESDHALFNGHVKRVINKKQAGITNASYEELANYLALYINFKLKVIDAKAMNLDADTSYQKEISGYEKSLKAQRKKLPKQMEYDFIINEYREGVLMFNVSEKKIWNKVLEGDDEVKAYYNRFSSKYAGSSFEEVHGQVIADYQQELEKEWIISLRNKYIIKINEDELKKLAKP